MSIDLQLPQTPSTEHRAPSLEEFERIYNAFRAVSAELDVLRVLIGSGGGGGGGGSNPNVYIQATDPSPVTQLSLWVKTVGTGASTTIDDLLLVTP